MKRILIGLLPIAACACTTAVPVVEESLKCDMPADMLAACAEPAAIKEGVTYGELIDVSRQDRASLASCSLRQKALADAAVTCTHSIDVYNEKVREINARNAQKK
jgi:hypothetical protein